MFSSIIQEQNEKYNHQISQLQQMLRSFFPEYLKGFFPRLYEQIDRNFIILLPSLIYYRKLPLVVFRTRKNGEDTVIFVYIDSEKEEAKIAQSMFQMYSMLDQMYHLPIIPTFLSLHEGMENRNIMMTDQDFFYYIAAVVKERWIKYIHENNVIAALLLQHMNFSDKDRFMLQIEIHKMLIRFHRNPKEDRLLYPFFTE